MSRWVARLKRWVPAPLFPIARWLYRRVLLPLYCRSVAVADTVLRRKYQGRVLPPAPLRFRVRGSPDGDSFALTGQQCSSDIAAALSSCGQDLAGYSTILDFGCGCAGTLLWLRDLAPQAEFFGTDIDRAAIRWCQQHVPFGSYSLNEPLPPLKFPDGSFDFVYAVSVFTHFNEDFQGRWLKELRRVVKPGGICLLSLHGPDTCLDLTPQQQKSVGDAEFAFVVTDEMKGLFPAWYQTAMHSKDYVFATFSAHFDILAYLPKGMNNHQDVVVLRRADAA